MRVLAVVMTSSMVDIVDWLMIVAVDEFAIKVIVCAVGILVGSALACFCTFLETCKRTRVDNNTRNHLKNQLLKRTVKASDQPVVAFVALFAVLSVCSRDSTDANSFVKVSSSTN